MQPSPTAAEHLIVFARRPLAGRVKTRLAAVVGSAATLALYRAFLCDTIALAGRGPDGRTVEIRFDAPWRPHGRADAPIVAALAGVRCTVQGPGDLGERLARAFAESRAAGHARTVVLGADAPTLPPPTIEAAFRALADGRDVALAPAADGGYVLLGARDTTRDLDVLFRDMPWGRPDVGARTLARAAAAGLSLARLPPWYDVDDAVGLRRLRHDLADREIAARAPASRAALDAHVPGG